MTMVQPRASWARQPQTQVDIDWLHPIARDFDLRFFFTVVGGMPVELVQGIRATPAGSAATQGSSIPVNGGGVASLSTAGSGYYELPHHQSYEITGEITLAWRGVLSTGSAFRHFAGKHASGGATNNPFDFRTTNDAAPKFALVRSAASGSSSNHWSNSNPLSLGIPQTAEVTQGALLNTTPTFYANGVQTAVFTNSTGPASPATASGVALRIGRRADGAVQMDGYTEYVVGWGRMIPADILAEFRRNPYALLRRRPETMFFGISGGGGSYKPAWSANANSVLQGSLAA